MFWRSYEEAIHELLDITTLTQEKWASSLKIGDASIYKPLLGSERLSDPNEGVDYFKHALRPHFVKGVAAVCICSLYQL